MDFNLKAVSHRSQFVAKSYSQVQGIQDRRNFVYRLHHHLYGMKDSPRGWGQLFASVCIDFELTSLKSDECVFVCRQQLQTEQAVHTFPEISRAVSVLSKYMLRPEPTHLVMAKKLLRYLKRPQTHYLAMVRSRLHRRLPPRYNLRLRWCLIHWYDTISSLICWICIPAQRSRNLMARKSHIPHRVERRRSQTLQPFQRHSRSHLSSESMPRAGISADKSNYHVWRLSSGRCSLQRESISQSQQTYLPSLELCCRTPKSRHQRHRCCWHKSYWYASRYILLTSAGF